MSSHFSEIQIPLILGVPHDPSVLIGPPGQKWNNVIQTPVRHKFTSMVASLGQRQGQVICHAHLLSKWHSAITRWYIVLIHELQCSVNCFFVVRGNKHRGVVVVHPLHGVLQAVVVAGICLRLGWMDRTLSSTTGSKLTLVLQVTATNLQDGNK